MDIYYFTQNVYICNEWPNFIFIFFQNVYEVETDKLLFIFIKCRGSWNERNKKIKNLWGNLCICTKWDIFILNIFLFVADKNRFLLLKIYDKVGNILNFGQYCYQLHNGKNTNLSFKIWSEVGGYLYQHCQLQCTLQCTCTKLSYTLFNQWGSFHVWTYK